MRPQITVLTATYNRGHLLGDLYKSLLRQTDSNFVWILVDDGSQDNTRELAEKWMKEPHQFQMEYIYKENGGKNRAINLGVSRVTTQYTLIIDSDDYLTDDAIEFFSNKIVGISGVKEIAGISGIKGEGCNTSLNHMKSDKVIASNLERKSLGLNRDCCEVYRTDLLLSHPFIIWKGEKFTPEEVVWNQLALEGYKLVWYNKITCIIRYQEDGMTKDSWNLYIQNPMGYAMMFNHRLLYSASFKEKAYNVIQMICCCGVKGEYGYLKKSNNKLLTTILFPLGWVLSVRRRKQMKRL